MKSSGWDAPLDTGNSEALNRTTKCAIHVKMKMVNQSLCDCAVQFTAIKTMKLTRPTFQSAGRPVHVEKLSL